jgi:hypothetical protein
MLVVSGQPGFPPHRTGGHVATIVCKGLHRLMAVTTDRNIWLTLMLTVLVIIRIELLDGADHIVRPSLMAIQAKIK